MSDIQRAAIQAGQGRWSKPHSIDSLPRTTTTITTAGTILPTCFVIMPITTPPDQVSMYGSDHDHFLHLIEHLFQPAIELAGYQMISPVIANSEVIQGEIIRNLEQSDLVLCDISGWNANVFFGARNQSGFE